MASMTGAQALVRSLAREGVEVVFALPGVQIMDAFDALHDEPGIRLVTVRHEQSTTFMADGYARTTGKVGVGLVVPGPGALNATAGLGTAYATSSPVLLICGQIESYNLGKERGALHEVEDLQDVFRPITKWCSRMMSVEAIPEGVHEAMRRLGTGRPRPVELEVPWDVLPRQGDAELPEAEVFPRQTPDPSKIQEAADLLANARRPLIWAGGGRHTRRRLQRGHGACRRPQRPRDHYAPGKGGHPGNQPPVPGDLLLRARPRREDPPPVRRDTGGGEPAAPDAEGVLVLPASPEAHTHRRGPRGAGPQPRHQRGHRRRLQGRSAGPPWRICRAAPANGLPPSWRP